jgi:predicted nucleic acid-binding Zn ribbon protein
MNSPALNLPTLLLPSFAESLVTVCHCPQCGKSLKGKQKTCSSKCRQSAYRKGEKGAAVLAAYKSKKKAQRKLRRQSYYQDKYGARSLGLHGWSGPIAKWLPALGSMKLPQL